ncbi:MAG: DNA repair protein RecN, partial [Clostridia bacterium]
ALLSEARRGRAVEAGQAVTAVLGDLDMPGAAIEIAVEAADASQYGEDRMLWHFRPAPGAQWKNLADAASGGEMARVTLALTLVEPERGLMVFDEVDAGLGGHAARRVAELLDRLRRSGTAVITVTHQAVVAATADLHYRAEKQETHGGFYEAHFEAVYGQARERELARMLSGSVDEAALQHARRLLEGSA